MMARSALTGRRWVHPSIGPALLLALLLALGGPEQGQAQGIVFNSDLPRTLVFIAEKGEGNVATRDFVAFLREAGFPLVDPALAHTAAQRELVRAALEGDEGAAVQLGRDFGAQVLILGRADWGANPDPVDRTLVTATAELDLRALRLDNGRVITTGRGQARKLEATEQAARTAAIREAASQILRGSPFVGRLINNWTGTAWSASDYFPADPGSVQRQLTAPASAGAPRVAVLDTRLLPPPAADGSQATRGIGVRRQENGAGGQVELEGVVLGTVAAVEVEGLAAQIRPLEPQLAQGLRVEGDARGFSARITLPASRDTLRIVARGPDGATTEALAAPRINRRWAVLVGVGQYQSPEIPDLAFAAADAEAMYAFLRSPAGGSIPEQQILLLKDGAATAQAMREALFVFLQQAAWDDLVLIYFAGHGAPDPHRPENLYLFPTDADPNALAATAFPMWDVKTALRRQIAAERVIVFADACHSAGALGEGANPIAGAFEELFAPSRRVTLTAANVGELAVEGQQWGGHGIFTHALLEGLGGAADLDRNGIVTFAEAARYVEEKVARETQGRQNPRRSGFGDVPLAELQALTP